MIPIAIYVHWPFCKAKCPYCDFNSHVRQSIPMEDFLVAYLKELEYYRPILHNRIITSVFFGGGTPSTAEPRIFAAILQHLYDNYHVADNIEITLEANPTSVEAEKFEDFAASGINRVSIGVQSFDSAQLQFLGREHSAREAIIAIKLAAKYFKRYSFDLIYALPQQSLDEWEKQLHHALQYADKHLSLYQLTIERGTKFFSLYQQKKIVLPDENTAAELYQLTQQIMEAHNLPQYEISNHAALGEESLHNLNYWQYGDYIGLGAGAHGRYLDNGIKISTVNHHSPEKWLGALQEFAHAMQSSSIVTELQQLQEKVMMGLRSNKGIAKSLLESNNRLPQLIAQGYIIEEEEIIKVNQKGRLVLNSIISQLFS